MATSDKTKKKEAVALEQKNNPFVDKVEGILDCVTKELVAQATVIEGKKKNVRMLKSCPTASVESFKYHVLKNCPECDWSDNDEWVQRQVDYDDAS